LHDFLAAGEFADVPGECESEADGNEMEVFPVNKNRLSITLFGFMRSEGVGVFGTIGVVILVLAFLQAFGAAISFLIFKMLSVW
jgi:site-specific recombinase